MRGLSISSIRSSDRYARATLSNGQNAYFFTFLTTSDQFRTFVMLDRLCVSCSSSPPRTTFPNISGLWIDNIVLLLRGIAAFELL